MNIDNLLNLLVKGRNENQAEGFIKFVSDKLWGLYDEYLMNKEIIAKSEVSRWYFDLPNAKENVKYEQVIDIPRLKDSNLVGVVVKAVEVKGIPSEELGLNVEFSNNGMTIKIFGTPNLDYFRKDGKTAESTYELVVVYRFDGLYLPEGENTSFEFKIPLVINQDPRKLWKNLPTDWDNMPEPKYRNSDTQADYIKVVALSDGTPQKDIVAASKRGRSHAQEAKPRDDNFLMYHDDKTNWYVMAVADGAGSAKLSREGSRIACNTVIEHCKNELTSSKKFEENINLWHIDEGSADAGKMISGEVYRIVGNAAYKAHNAIISEATKNNIPAKNYATTLLLAICKRFDFGWFIASFWVGDGAICIYDEKNNTSTMMGTPDEGEYAGQTRFLTMPEIFSDTNELFKRLKCKIVPDFTALFLMTDGVSDPKFETDANLNNVDKWTELWQDLQNNPDHPVHLCDGNEKAKDELLEWLDFWSAGNHDDRTIAILY